MRYQGKWKRRMSILIYSEDYELIQINKGKIYITPIGFSKPYIT